jgi:hypothetical protein
MRRSAPSWLTTVTAQSQPLLQHTTQHPYAASIWSSRHQQLLCGVRYSSKQG